MRHGGHLNVCIRGNMRREEAWRGCAVGRPYWIHHRFQHVRSHDTNQLPEQRQAGAVDIGAPGADWEFRRYPGTYRRRKRGIIERKWTLANGSPSFLQELRG